MFGVALLAAALIGGASTATPSERRCGWLSNPTPANWYLFDGDGRWVLGEQGGYQMPEANWGRLPRFQDGQWIRVNTADYGYGCACLDVATDRRSRQVTQVRSSRALPLRQCRTDPRLRRHRFD